MTTKTMPTMMITSTPVQSTETSKLPLNLSLYAKKRPTSFQILQNDPNYAETIKEDHYVIVGPAASFVGHITVPYPDEILEK